MKQPLFLATVFAGLLASSVQAAMTPLWQIGVDDDPFEPGAYASDEFSAENNGLDRPPGKVTRLPGDPDYVATNNPAADDDFYCAGTYPIGFNSLTNVLNVPQQEPDAAWERALTGGDLTNRVHFMLSTTQILATARYRLEFELVDGGQWIGAPVNADGEGFAAHEVTVHWRTAAGQMTLLYSSTVTRASLIALEFAATQVMASAGANSLVFKRHGPLAIDGGFWVHFDYAKLHADPDALLDGDGDGLPQGWEIECALSDTNALDSAEDQDGDTLTAAQEFAAGTHPQSADSDADGLRDDLELSLGSHPLLRDTDGDGLDDGDEVNGTPASSPLLSDTDGDGAPDAWERRVGSNPTLATSQPTIFRGAFGIHFVSLEDVDGKLGSNEVAGVIPQMFWNDTLPLRTYNRTSGATAHISTPTTGRVVRSDGHVLTNVTINWISSNSDANNNRGQPDRRLMNGYLRADSGAPAVLTISNIPFAVYDLFVHVGGRQDDQLGRVVLGTNWAGALLFQSMTTAPRSNFVEITAANRLGNVVRYANQTGAVVSVTVTNVENGSLGLHAVQVVDVNLDADASGIPDWYEMLHALQPASIALAAADSDGDGLSNLQEYQRRSNPNQADTDGDGLQDGQESATNALTADSDGDGLSDGAEARLPLPTNPNLADTDGDGVNDRLEAQRGTDGTYNPTNSPTYTGLIPRFTNAPSRWEWNLENVQLVWNHTVGALAPDIWNEDQLLILAVINSSSTDWRTIGMELRYFRGSLTYLLDCQHNGGFSYFNQPTWGIWDTDFNTPPADLTAALGFSGHGPADLSDRLRFRFLATRAVLSNSWNITFEIRNLTRSSNVVSRSFTNYMARNSDLDNGTVRWRNYDGVSNAPTLLPHPGFQLFITPTPLEDLPAFAAYKDSDNDGMPDGWETSNSFNSASAADATGDTDGDGLVNRDEYVAGTQPRNRDTDGDGVSDGMERELSTHPLETNSRPAYAGSTWPSGEDLDGNGLPDAWETRYGAFHLTPDGDADGDGASNAQEAGSGTDPLDAGSVLSITMTRETNDVVVSWPQREAKQDRVASGPWLTNGQPQAGSAVVTGGMVRLRLTNRLNSAQAIEFFHVTASDLDSDLDGVSDWSEGVLGSNPTRRDSVRQDMPALGPTGAVLGTISGDYSAFVEQYRGGPAATGTLSRVQAARFLQQASFGPTVRSIEHVQRMGIPAWIDDQILHQPASLHRPYIEQIYADYFGPRTDLTYSYAEESRLIRGQNCPTPFARAALSGPDQLRQRVAFALSQILVASRRDPGLENKPLAMMDFYDIFVRHAFGNYADILTEVTWHPVMGRYLSHLGNQRARPEINQFPDENFAREVQQLFTIGLWELNPDGTRKLDANLQPIPTYGTRQVTEFARVFTGLWLGGQDWGSGGWTDDDYAVPMQMWVEKHDFEAKSLLRGVTIPARAPTLANARRDVEDALRCLFEHPNTGPFVGRQLIQFLVTSNPSTGYVARVAAAFDNNGAGRRGDLSAVVTAILLDEEARDARHFLGNPAFGRLKEPVQRALALARVGRLDRHANILWWDWGFFYKAAFQEPTFSPSVFNFYRPDYQPPGLLTQSGLVGPAFQIADSYAAISFPNALWEQTIEGFVLDGSYDFPPDYADLLAVAGNTEALVDQVNLLFCAGGMTAPTRAALVSRLDQVAAYERLTRVHLAVYVAATCPEGAVQR
jgi:uncharacterized protein (DUF1800 family)